MISQVPLDHLGFILKACVVDEPDAVVARAQYASFNLISRDTHAALPKALTATLQPDDLDDDAWEGLSRTPILPDGLSLDLDRVGTSAFSGLDPATLSASLRRIAQRFSSETTLRLTATQPTAIHAAAQFAQHAAPHLPSVRRLSITTSTEANLPPFWLVPTFAHLGATVRVLHVSGHSSTVSRLAGNLPAVFPAIAALHLTLHVSPPPQTGAPPFRDLFVCAPSRLRALHVQVVEPVRRDPDTPTDDSFMLAVVGSPASLQRLTVRCTSKSHTGGYLCRPVAIAGRLPALTQLDLTVPPTICSSATIRSVIFPLREACPGVARLLLRTAPPDRRSRECAWVIFKEHVMPMFSSLSDVQLLENEACL